MKVKLEKEPDNKYDQEATVVRLKGLGDISFVVNITNTVIGESLSVGRLYDKIGKKAMGEVAYVMMRVLCRLRKKSLKK